MAYSVDVKVATGSTNTFTFAFSGLNHGFLSEDDIHVYVENVPREYELLSESMLTVTGAIIPAGSRVTIRRETPVAMPVVDWIDGGQLNEQLLDNQTAQLLYLCQEALDGYAISDVWRDLSINNYTIRGIGMDRNDPTSAATVGFFEEVAERAEHAEAMADQYKDAAHNSSVAAANSEGEAASSADLASRWASEEEDVVVLDGKYSAYHHAKKAADEAADAAYDAQRAEDAADRAEAVGGAATNTTMGIVRPDLTGGSGLNIIVPGELRVAPATAGTIGGVIIGDGLSIEMDGTISADIPEINLATDITPGIVKPGLGLTIADGGALNVSYWDAFPPYVPIPVWGVTFGGSDGRRAIMPGEAKAREDWIKCDGGSDGSIGTTPNLLDRVLVGASTTNTAGSIGGSPTHSHTLAGSVSASTLSSAQLANHSHSVTAGFKTSNETGWQGGGGTNNIENRSLGTTAAGSNATHSHTLTGDTGNANNYQPFLAAHFVMKVA